MLIKYWVIKSNINRIKIKNKSLLEYYYLSRKYSVRKLAKIFKVHHSTISRTLKRMNIKTKYKLTLNLKYISHLYLINQYSMQKIANKLHCSRSVIYRILQKLLIKIRPKSFYAKKEKNNRWLGGLSYIDYPRKWFIKIRESIRKRDNYKCQLCNKKGKHVHHIDYNKNNCKENNLITLCLSCHLTTNSNRDYWFAYFTYIMENK
jgi:predicted transcriptional regulator